MNLKWHIHPRCFKKFCVWYTVPRSRWRVVKRGEDLGDCEAQFHSNANGKWVMLSCHKNLILAMRACGKHRSQITNRLPSQP